MGTAEDYRAASQAAYDEPLEIVLEGDTSDDVSKYLPLASGALTEVVSDQLKKQEAAKKEAALKSSEGYKAQQAAADAQKQAAMLQADAITEADLNGPKHKAAATAALAAQAAAAKAAYFASGATPGAAMSAFSPAGGHGSEGGSFFEKYKWPILGVGAIGAIGAIVLATRKK